MFNSLQFISSREHPPLVLISEADLHWYFYAADNIIKPHWRCTFGMPDGNKLFDYKLLINKLLIYFNSSNLSKVEIKLPPEKLNPREVNSLKETLLESGFKISYTEINQSIDLRANLKLSRGAKHKLNLAHKNGFQFQLESSLLIELIFKFLQTSRTNSGYPTTITYSGLLNLLSELDTQTFTSAVYSSNGTVMAIGIVLKLKPDYWYTLYLADNHAFRKFSPTTFLVSKMAQYAKYQGIKTLDLGISTEHGIPNTGLMNFKDSLGAEKTEQLVFEYWA